MSQQHRSIERLSTTKAKEVRSILEQVLVYNLPTDLTERLCLEKREDWVAVPTRSSNAFGDAVIRLAEYSKHRKLFGVYLCTYPDQPIVFSVPSTLDSLYRFEVEPPPGLKVLFAGAPDWIVLDMDSELCVVAGSITAVENFLNTSIDQAFTEFKTSIDQALVDLKTFAESSVLPPDVTSKLQPLAGFPQKVYRNVKKYQFAAVGSRINLLEGTSTHEDI